MAKEFEGTIEPSSDGENIQIREIPVVPQKIKIDVSGGFWGSGFSGISKLLLIALVAVLVYFKGDDWVDKIFAAQPPPITEATVVRIAENLIRVQGQANQARFDALLDKMDEREARYMERADNVLRNALKQAQEYAKENNAQINQLGTVVAQLQTSFEESTATDVYEDEEKPSRSFEDYDLVREMEDGSELKTGWVKYHPEWEGDDKLVQYHYPLEYKLDIIRAQERDGGFTYFTEAWIENNFVPSQRGQKFPITLEEVNFEEKPLIEKRWMWNPRLGLEIGATTDALFPAIDFSLFSYGLTKSDMDWRFMTVGLGMAGWYEESNSVGLVTFTPVSYNLGKALPVVENLFIGPTISASTEADTGYGFTLQIPF